MTPSRFATLQNDGCEAKPFTPSEAIDGVHYCPDWDGYLLHPESPDSLLAGCTCDKIKRTKPTTKIEPEDYKW